MSFNGFELQTELQARKALRQAFLELDPVIGAEAKITRLVWSELHGLFYATIRFMGRDYFRSFPPAARAAGEEVAAVAEGVMREAAEHSAPTLRTLRH